MVIATPYPLETDHWKLSREIHLDFEEALELVRAQMMIDASAPIYRIGHSLGAKLLVLGACFKGAGTADPIKSTTDSLGLISFNNFALADSLKLVTNVVERLGPMRDATATIKGVLDMVQSFAATQGTSIPGVEVSPSPVELDEAIERSFSASNTGIWRFANDDLDSSQSLLDAMPETAIYTLKELEGSHLSPVVFRLEAEQIDPSLAMLAGSRGFKFGDAVALEPLIQSVANWIYPKRLPSANAEEVEDEIA